MFLRNESIICDLLYVKSMDINPKRDLIIDLAADCYPSAGASYRLNPAQQICRLIVEFDECEVGQHFNGFVPLSDRKWIPIEEELPAYKENVLVYAKSPDWTQGKIVVGCRTYTDIDGEHWAVDYAHYITHWKPLPASPTELTGQQKGGKS